MIIHRTLFLGIIFIICILSISDAFSLESRIKSFDRAAYGSMRSSITITISSDTYHHRASSSSSSRLNAREGPLDEEVENARKLFWESQAKLAASMRGMTEEAAAELKKEEKAKFAARRLALVSDSAFFSVLIFSLLWIAFDNPFIAISYGFGSTMGTAYSYGLGRFVETLGGSVDDDEALAGAGVGQARFAFLILLFVIVGKFKAQGLLELPSIAGFFTYQLASLNQGIKEYED